MGRAIIFFLCEIRQANLLKLRQYPPRWQCLQRGFRVKPEVDASGDSIISYFSEHTPNLIFILFSYYGLFTFTPLCMWLYIKRFRVLDYFYSLYLLYHFVAEFFVETIIKSLHIYIFIDGESNYFLLIFANKLFIFLTLR